MEELRNSLKQKSREWFLDRSKDLFWSCVAIFSFCHKEKFHDFGRLQARMCDFLADKMFSKKLLSVDRGSLKTTTLLGYSLWRFGWANTTGIDDSINYNTATKDNSENFYQDFRFELMNNPLYQWVFKLPTTQSEYNRFSKKEIRMRHVSISFSSHEEQQASRHAKCVINDDLVNEINCRTENSRKDVIDNWQFQKSVLTKLRKKRVGTEIDVGTPYHYQDLMWKLISENKTYTKFIEACIEGYPDVSVADVINRRKPLTYPELKTYEDLIDLLEEQGSQKFSSQYLLLPLNEEVALAKQDWIQIYKTSPEIYYRTMVIEPGGSEPAVHDPTGITIVDTDTAGRLYVVYAVKIWKTPVALMEMVKSLMDEFEPDDTRIEREKYGIVMKDIFETKYPNLNMSYVSHGKRPKGGKVYNEASRIWRLRQWLEKKRILFHDTMTELIDDLLHYPQVEHDCLLDSLAYHLDIFHVPDKKIKRFEPEVEESFVEELNVFISRRKGSMGDAQVNDRVY